MAAHGMAAACGGNGAPWGGEDLSLDSLGNGHGIMPSSPLSGPLWPTDMAVADSKNPAGGGFPPLCFDAPQRADRFRGTSAVVKDPRSCESTKKQSRPPPLLIGDGMTTRECPCCRTQVDGTSLDYHRHLVRCLILATGHKKSKKIDPRDVRKRVAAVRSSIAKLDLRLRISIMESFYRLSRTASPHASSSPVSPSLSSNAVATDDRVLSLLYGVNQVPQTRGRSHRNRKRNRAVGGTAHRLPPPPGVLVGGSSQSHFYGI